MKTSAGRAEPARAGRILLGGLSVAALTACGPQKSPTRPIAPPTQRVAMNVPAATMPEMPPIPFAYHVTGDAGGRAETWEQVACKFSVPVRTLMKANPGRTPGQKLTVGEELMIPMIDERESSRAGADESGAESAGQRVQVSDADLQETVGRYIIEEGHEARGLHFSELCRLYDLYLHGGGTLPRETALRVLGPPDLVLRAENQEHFAYYHNARFERDSIVYVDVSNHTVAGFRYNVAGANDHAGWQPFK